MKNWKMALVILAGILLGIWLMIGLVKATQKLTNVVATGISNMYSPE